MLFLSIFSSLTYRSSLFFIFLCIAATLGIVYYLELPGMSSLKWSASVRSYNNIAADMKLFQADLYRRIRVLCIVPSAPKNKAKRDAVLDTWGPRCNKLIFAFGDPTFQHNYTDTEKIQFWTFNMSDGVDAYMKLWEKLILSFRHTYDCCLDDFDWMLKADDNTYVEMTNLRLFLADLNEADSDSHYYGSSMDYIGGYNSGGAGYVMSKNVFKKLVEIGINEKICDTSVKNKDYEDTQMGYCLRKLNITMANTMDSANRLRFSLTNLPEMITMKIRNWFWDVSPVKWREGVDCCSDTAITYHNVDPTMMRVMDYLINMMSPFHSRLNNYYNTGALLNNSQTNSVAHLA